VITILGSGMKDGFCLSNAQWERVRPLLPNKRRGLPRVDDRRALSGIT
jgi:transposase